MRNNRLYYEQNTETSRWIVSYADFITMLLALFIVLYAVSQLDIAQMKNFSQSVKQSFSSFEGNKSSQVKAISKIFSTTSANIKTKPIEYTLQEQVENLKKKLQEAEAKASNEMSDLERVKNMINEKLPTKSDINMVNSERGLVISLADTFLFDPGSANIKPEAASTLDKLSSILKTLPNSIRIEGHTDNTPIKTALYPSNWELSTARATSLVKLFVEKYKYSPNKLSAGGYGEFRPLSPNTTPEGRQANRRVDIVILNTGSQIFEPSNVNNN